MRRYSTSAEPSPAQPSSLFGKSNVPRSDWQTVRNLLPYVWHYKWRVILALVCLVAAKVANLGVPILMKKLVDNMNVPAGSASALLVVPVG